VRILPPPRSSYRGSQNATHSVVDKPSQNAMHSVGDAENRLIEVRQATGDALIASYRYR
jgi:hypothetical protein